jgi:hypothetical protein
MRKISVLEFVSLDGSHTSPRRAKGRYQWRLRIWRVDESTCRRSEWSGHDEADENAV